MNFRWKENPALRQVLLGCLFILFLFTLGYLFTLLRPVVSGLELFARANSTRTSIALTSNALLGPFPTATGPTPTPANTSTITSTPTVTPSGTPSPTPFRYFINTGTPRTLVPGSVLTSTAATSVPTRTPVRPTSTSIPPTQTPRPTSTSIAPTNPPVQPTSTSIPPTNPPQPTASQPAQPTNPPPQPTDPPKKPTKTPKPPKPPHPSKTPKKYPSLVECANWQSCSYFGSEETMRMEWRLEAQIEAFWNASKTET